MEKVSGHLWLLCPIPGETDKCSQLRKPASQSPIELGRERDRPEEVIRSVKVSFFRCISCCEKLTSISWTLAKHAWDKSIRDPFPNAYGGPTRRVQNLRGLGLSQTETAEMDAARLNHPKHQSKFSHMRQDGQVTSSRLTIRCHTIYKIVGV